MVAFRSLLGMLCLASLHTTALALPSTPNAALNLDNEHPSSPPTTIREHLPQADNPPATTSKVTELKTYELTLSDDAFDSTVARLLELLQVVQNEPKSNYLPDNTANKKTVTKYIRVSEISPAYMNTIVQTMNGLIEEVQVLQSGFPSSPGLNEIKEYDEYHKIVPSREVIQ